METGSFLKSFFTEHWKYMAVNTACKLNLFDAIENKPNNAIQLAKELNLDNNSLETLLKALVSINFLEKNNALYFLNDNSSQLTEKHPKSLKYSAMVWAEEHLSAWQNLEYSIKTGKSSFSHLTGENYFDYLNNNPDKLHKYHKAMYEYARDDYADLATKIDFKKHKSILDVGGGYGASISSIKKNCPEIECALFDLKKVIENCKLPTIKLIDGDFFTSIPLGYDAIILSRILHDWNNEKCKIILDNCYKALPKGGTLYVIENCSDLIQVDLSLLSLNMLAMCESFERTFLEYTELFCSVGFILQSTIQLNELQTIIIATKP